MMSSFSKLRSTRGLSESANNRCNSLYLFFDLLEEYLLQINEEINRKCDCGESTYSLFGILE